MNPTMSSLLERRAQRHALRRTVARRRSPCPRAMLPAALLLAALPRCSRRGGRGDALPRPLGGRRLPPAVLPRHRPPAGSRRARHRGDGFSSPPCRARAGCGSGRRRRPRALRADPRRPRSARGVRPSTCATARRSPWRWRSCCTATCSSSHGLALATVTLLGLAAGRRRGARGAARGQRPAGCRPGRGARPPRRAAARLRALVGRARLRHRRLRGQLRDGSGGEARAALPLSLRSPRRFSPAASPGCVRRRSRPFSGRWRLSARRSRRPPWATASSC